MSYDLTFMESSRNLLTVVQGINDASGGLLGTLFIIILWIGLFMAFKKEESLTEWIISSFITSIVAILFVLIELISWQIMLIPVFMLLGSLMIKFLGGKE